MFARVLLHGEPSYIPGHVPEVPKSLNKKCPLVLFRAIVRIESKLRLGT